MRIDPALAALRADPASQRRAQTAMRAHKQAWQDDARIAPILSALDEFGLGKPVEHCDALLQLIEQPERARDLAAAFVNAMTQSCRAEPFGLVPFRHSSQSGHASMELAASHGASLWLHVYDQAGLGATAARSVAFPDIERHEIVLAGEAEARIVRRSFRTNDASPLDFEAITLSPGAVLSFDGPSSTRLIDRVHGTLVVLRLTRTVANPRPADEVLLETGAILHRASGTKLESQREIALELLGRMGRGDAAEAMEQQARHGSDQKRWLAIRECLALDVARGFHLLAQCAANSDDSLAATAGALRAQLIEAHPELEALACPA